MRKFYMSIFTVIFSLAIAFGPVTAVFASDSGDIEYLDGMGPVNNAVTGDQYSHFTDEGFEVFIDDAAGYLTEEQVIEVVEVMKDTARYGNAMFLTTDDHNYYSTESFAVSYFEGRYGTASKGVVFVIDRCIGEIYLASEGSLRKDLTNSRCTTITDNTYFYATEAGGKKDSLCAIKTFEQVNRVLDGKIIAAPMKIICAALLSIVIAMIINYFVAMSYSKPRKPSKAQVLNGIFSQVKLNNAQAVKTNTKRIYSPRTSESSSSGSSSHSSSGGGGGGRSSGGGGHSGGGHKI